MTGSKKAKRKRWDWIPEVLISITVYQKDILRLLLVDIRSYLLCSNPCSWNGMVSSSLAATLRLNSKMARRLRRHLPGKKQKLTSKMISSHPSYHGWTPWLWICIPALAILMPGDVLWSLLVYLSCLTGNDVLATACYLLCHNSPEHPLRHAEA